MAATISRHAAASPGRNGPIHKRLAGCSGRAGAAGGRDNLAAIEGLLNGLWQGVVHARYDNAVLENALILSAEFGSK